METSPLDYGAVVDLLIHYEGSCSTSSILKDRVIYGCTPSVLRKNPRVDMKKVFSAREDFIS